LVNEEVVYLIFQLELDGALQRALNLEAFEAAQQVRARREQVDLALREVAKRKARAAAAARAGVTASMSEGEGGGEGGDDEAAKVAAAAAAAAELTEADVATEGLRLRTEMARAASEERYADAARYRDQLADLERRAKQAAAALEEAGGAGAVAADPDAVPSAPPVLPLRLGQRVVHRAFGYRGVVVGWDSACCEDDDWIEATGAADSPGGGLKQRHYHVLVDVRDWPPDPAQPPVAYVADAMLSAPERDEPGSTWIEAYGGEGQQGGGVAAFGGASRGGGQEDEDEDGAFRHPYAYVLFLGQDAAGDLLPCRQLRDRYNQQRRDVWRPGAKKDEEDEEEDDDRPPPPLGGGGDGGSGGGGGGGKGPTRIPGIDMSSLM
jgi:hemimethylated DNA binding protein